MPNIEDFFKHSEYNPEVYENNNNNNFIYLLQEREFINSGDPIYKLGKTSNPKNRMSSYPKGSMILFLTLCNDCGIAEREILFKFRQIFISRSDIGSEYFYGNKFDMLRVLYNFFNGVF